MKNNAINDDILKDYLRNSIVTKEAAKELNGYLEDAFKRFQITFDLVPDTSINNNLLELGSNPYFLTLMIKKYKNYNLKLANYFGEGHPLRMQQIENEKYNETHTFEFEQFNVENQRFPYADGEFGVVLCCEILEHLVEDPIFMLSEIHRVLDINGILILTTPNVCRSENITRLKNGENIYDPYSGYGIYGRHNREYTVKEIEEILTNTGFEVEEVYSKNVHKRLDIQSFLSSDDKIHGDNIFAKARKKGKFNYYYPEYLFRSFQRKLIVNQSYVRMGENDSVQLGDGWYPLEDWGQNYGFIRWTTGFAECYLNVNNRPTKLIIEAYMGVDTISGIIEIVYNDVVVYSIENTFKQGVLNYQFELNEININGNVKVNLEFRSTWNPVNHGSTDNRELGIAVRYINLV